MDAATGQRFTRTEHVRRRADFERAYSSGSRIQARYMTVFVVPNGGSGARLGVARHASWARRPSGTGPNGSPGKCSGVTSLQKAWMWLSFRGGKCSMPSSASLEADYRAALASRHRARPAQRRPRGQSAPRRDSRV